MNKSERLNDMMLFLNDKNLFHLKDIMEKYQISRSTAIRDIQSLEKIGMPLFSKPGRNGCYGILRNRLLSPIVFHIDEVFALYFSMLTLKAYESTPFHLCVEKLKEKFENCLSQEKIEKLRKTEKVFQLGSIKHYNHCSFLDKILQYAIEEKICSIKYRKREMEKYYIVQFFNISSAYGQWYAIGHDFETDCPKVFRCDKILEITENSQYDSKPLSEFLKPAELLYKTRNAITFEVEISKKGVDLFHKEHYPSMRIFQENEQYFIRGFYNKGEENFISNYLMGYGKDILSIKPTFLKDLLINQLEDIKNHMIEIDQ